MQALRLRKRGFIRPCEQRKLNQKESQKRFARKEFKYLMYWVMKRKERCVLQLISSLSRYHPQSI